MKDYGANLAERGEVLHPGSTSVEDERWAVRPGNAFVRLDVKVSAVVYSDQTADAADAEALGRIQSHRSAVASALAKSRDILERSLADNSSDHPGAKASDEVKKIIKSGPADNVYLKSIGDELEAASQAAAQLGVSERDYLNQRLTKLQRDAARESRYAQIRRAQ
jgi:hypothetical protein